MLALDTPPRPTDAQRCIGRVLGSVGPTAIPDPPENVETLIEPLACHACTQAARHVLQSLDCGHAVRCRGVMAALPRNVWPASPPRPTPLSVESSPSIHARHRAIVVVVAATKASEYTHRTAYAVDDCTSVHHTDGLEDKATRGCLPMPTMTHSCSAPGLTASPCWVCGNRPLHTTSDERHVALWTSCPRCISVCSWSSRLAQWPLVQRSLPRCWFTPTTITRCTRARPPMRTKTPLACHG